MNASREPKRILVVANETVGGRALIERVRDAAMEAHEELRPFEVTVICPQNRPRRGAVIYDESVSAAAENRLKMTITELRRVGIEAKGEIVDPDPYAAIEDHLGSQPTDQIIISTHPETRSGWQQRDLVDRVQDLGVPVEHVVVDLDTEREASGSILVVANQTAGGQALLELLKDKAQDGERRIVLIVPQSDERPREAEERLAGTLQQLEDAGLEAVGQVMDPDPYVAIHNALQFYVINEIVISTFPETRSGWLRSDLVERVRSSTDLPVEHVLGEEDGSADEDGSPEERGREGASA